MIPPTVRDVVANLMVAELVLPALVGSNATTSNWVRRAAWVCHGESVSDWNCSPPSWLKRTCPSRNCCRVNWSVSVQVPPENSSTTPFCSSLTLNRKVPTASSMPTSASGTAPMRSVSRSSGALKSMPLNANIAVVSTTISASVAPSAAAMPSSSTIGIRMALPCASCACSTKGISLIPSSVIT